VAKVDTGRGGELVTVVGSLLGARPGEALRLRGKWGSHPQYGRQFQVRTSPQCSRRRCRVCAGISDPG
jgi:exodeoxyribonuclease V alpha subunit